MPNLSKAAGDARCIDHLREHRERGWRMILPTTCLHSLTMTTHISFPVTSTAGFWPSILYSSSSAMFPTSASSASRFLYSYARFSPLHDLYHPVALNMPKDALSELSSTYFNAQLPLGSCQAGTLQKRFVKRLDMPSLLISSTRRYGSIKITFLWYLQLQLHILSIFHSPAVCLLIYLTLLCSHVYIWLQSYQCITDI